ncbi:hypothetical protein [Mucilaginibacter sp.]|uniref:hypothetical protein n=1 Tax=Mucilaginibacter sp. TaxID=1882438 RepID=UPI00263483E2|nr:hypothetical protein [Mucilaginibacter sp.]MDB5128352.1 hypothetical protein [Mucilaginibacter sp.]
MAAKLAYRYLRGYTLDPGFSTQLDTMKFNQTTYRILWEDLNAPENLGPAGEYFEVIDIDPPSNCYYEPINLDSREVLSQNGLTPSEGNPQFHQQFVYTIAMKTLEYFEQSLGRKLIWNSRVTHESGKIQEHYVKRIRLYPHAFRDANAYYSTEKKSILFGYFQAAQQIQGTNFPNGAVFACLSPDIISHEVTHALLDSIHPRFLENTNPDVPAFHEAFADIIALLQRFTINELVINQFAQSDGSFDKFTYLGELATQLGSALSHGRGALRSAIGGRDENGNWKRSKADPTLYQTKTEAHDRGSVLVSTFFDALIKVYNYKTQDLIRIATNGSGVLPQGVLQLDLATRLAQEVCAIAQHLMRIAIRALDYCPPLDITFGEYLRALVTADIDFAPADDNNYRIALIDAFRSWGIFPDHVNTFSEESLQWCTPDNFAQADKKALVKVANFLRGRVRTLYNLSNREAIYHESKKIQAALHDFLLGKVQTDDNNDCKDEEQVLGKKELESLLPKLGLSSTSVDYYDSGNQDENRKLMRQKNPGEPMPIEIHKVRPAYRSGREGMILEQVVVTITQSTTILIETGRVDEDTKEPIMDEMKFRGGCTLIFNMADEFKVNYLVTKNIASQDRFLKQLRYQQGGDDAALSFSDSMYDDDNGFGTINFANLHFH